MAVKRKRRKAAPADDDIGWLRSLRRPALARLVAAANALLAGKRAKRRPEESLEVLGTRLETAAASAARNLKRLPLRIGTDMEPRLQLAVANHRTGKPDTAAAGAGEIAVAARVRSVEQWRLNPDVLPGSTMGSRDGGRSWIVTGRVAVDRLEAVRAARGVLSLKAAQPLRAALDATVRTMAVGPRDLPRRTAPDGGRGVVIGVIDHGCDFAHGNFRRRDGRTRLLALWHQTGVATPQSPFGYGRVWSRADIDAALATADPYRALRYGPPVYRAGTHGTHVLDIAAGNGRTTGLPGVAPHADLVFVEASTADVATEGPAAVGHGIGDSVHLLEAVRFVFDTAGDRPCVCNLSLGTNSGPHDGTSLVEQGLDAIVHEKPNRAVVVAAGNAGEEDIHASGRVVPGRSHDIGWTFQGRGGGELELWYPGRSRLAVRLIAPDGTTFGPVRAGKRAAFGTSGRISLFIANRLGDPNNGDNVIGIWAAKGLAGRDWIVRLTSTDAGPVDYHAWIERNDDAQSSFTRPTATHCLTSLSTGRESIVVGCYDARRKDLAIAPFSSAGPTRDGRRKPEVSAPGVNVRAARSRSKSVTRKSGTSMATPAVAGLVALIFAEARRRKADLTISALRRKLMAMAFLDPPKTSRRWDGRYGRGRAGGRAVPINRR